MAIGCLLARSRGDESDLVGLPARRGCARRHADVRRRGKIYGQFNAKWIYIASVFLFEVGSAVCGAAPSMDALIIGRAIAGWGGAGMYVGVLTLLAGTTSAQERPTYIGLTGLTWGAGASSA